ncbi:MAG: hypothetical protein ACRDNH_01040 [Gaiellaceae bacterium]
MPACGDSLPDSGRALVVGHSPTNEAAVLELTSEIVAPLAKNAGVLSSPVTTAIRSSGSESAP